MSNAYITQFCETECAPAPFEAEQDAAGRYIPPGLLLQWHITERCNLRCAHCYQDVFGGKELSFEQLLAILSQYTELLSRWRKDAGRKVWGHITITGGEPFVRADFMDLLNIFSLNKRHYSFAILTNGSFVDSAMAKKLSRLSPSFVQVSIEGMKETHDKIRGQGNFEQTVSAIRHLVGACVRTLISFTAHRENYKEFGDVAKLGQKLGVSRVWSDRMLPRGNGAGLKDKMMTPRETREFFEMMLKAKKGVSCPWWRRKKTDVAMHRALQFLVSGGTPYHCTAGDTLITVQPNGDLYPCRRMPVAVGNLMETPLNELYYKNELFLSLRDKNAVSKGCEGCSFTKSCRGGLKCLSYAVTGNAFTADPGCWVARYENAKSG